MNKLIKSVTIILVAFLFLSTYQFSHADTTEDSWTEKAPMPTARDGLGVAVVNGKIYAIGGLNNVTCLNVNEEYDPVTDTWTTMAPMPTARSGFAIAVYQNKIYVIGGTVGDSNSVVSGFTGVNEVYDPVTNKWTTKASMPTPRADLSASIADGKIYLIGGKKYQAYDPYYHEVDTNEVYDPVNDSWSTKSPMTTPVFGYASAVVDNKIYVIGGARQFWTRWDLTFSSSTQVYDPATDKWSSRATFPTSGSYMSAGATAGINAPKRIYVVGGYAVNDYSNVTHVYDPERNVWSTATPMPTIRVYLGVAVVDDVLYAIGGYDGTNFLDTNEQYTPAGYGTVPPKLQILSPENRVYSSIQLVFSVNKPTAWIGYSLDGQANVTITGNTTLSGLSDGSHRIILYANGSFGNMGASSVAPFSVDTTPPKITMISPENKTYDTTDIQSAFTFNEPVTWVGYSLDGKDNVTITGNITLAALPEGSHSLTVYAEDAVGNIGASKTVYFSIQLFPTTLVVAAAVTVIIATAAGYLFLKRRKLVSKT